MDERREDRPADEEQTDAVAADQAEAHAESVEQLRALAAQYKEEAERNWQQFLHSAADLENYKKQALRQREDAVQHVRASFLSVILAVVDNLERALEHAGREESGQAIAEGIRMTHRQVLDLLANMGVRPMETRGQAFDPKFHEAVDVADSGAHLVTPGTVVDEVQKGYLLNGEILRPARVRVAK